MENIYIPLLSALAGAVIGAIASIATVWVQASIQARRDRIKHASELALYDYKNQLELAEKSGKPHTIPPISLYLHYHLELSKEMEKGEITKEALARIARSNTQIFDTLKELNK